MESDTDSRLPSTEDENSLAGLREKKKKQRDDAELIAKLEPNLRGIRQNLDLFCPKVVTFLTIDSQVRTCC